MRFYNFSDNSPYERQWVRAASIHATSHIVHWYCSECGRAANYPAGSFDVMVEEGSAFPDFLACGAFPLLIVSERVLRDWEQAKFSSFRHFPVGIAEVSESQALKHLAPAYYRIEITGECMVDFARSGASIKSVCSRCATIDLGVPYIKKYRLLDGSWDGSPLFRDHRFFPSVSFCSEEVKQFVDLNRYTNVRFEPME
jgi:hypothetical protein